MKQAAQNPCTTELSSESSGVDEKPLTQEEFERRLIEELPDRLQAAMERRNQAIYEAGQIRNFLGFTARLG